MKLCTKFRFYRQFESTLPILGKSFYLKNNWRVRNCPMYEISPLSPIASTRCYYGTFAPASALSHPLRLFCARWLETDFSPDLPVQETRKSCLLQYLAFVYQNTRSCQKNPPYPRYACALISRRAIMGQLRRSYTHRPVWP